MLKIQNQAQHHECGIEYEYEYGIQTILSETGAKKKYKTKRHK